MKDKASGVLRLSANAYSIHTEEECGKKELINQILSITKFSDYVACLFKQKVKFIDQRTIQCFAYNFFPKSADTIPWYYLE